MQHRRKCHLLSGEAARANGNVAKKFVRNQRQMNGIARQYGSYTGAPRGAKKVRLGQEFRLPRGRLRDTVFTPYRRNGIQQTFRFEKPFQSSFAVKNHRTFPSKRTCLPARACTSRVLIPANKYTRTNLREMHEPFQ